MDDAIRELAVSKYQSLLLGLLDSTTEVATMSADVMLVLIRALGLIPGALGEGERCSLLRLASDADADQDIREAAATALGRRGGLDVIKDLERLTSDERNEMVRETIQEAIEEILGHGSGGSSCK